MFLSLCPGNKLSGGGCHQTERFPPQTGRQHHPGDVALYQFRFSGKGASLLSDCVSFSIWSLIRCGMKGRACSCLWFD